MAAADNLLALAHETACEAIRAREATLELRRAAGGTLAVATPPNDAQIRQVAKAYGIPVRHRQLRHIVGNLADVLLEDVSSAEPRTCKTVLAFGPETDLREWKARDVLPTSAYHEAARSILVARDLPTDIDAVSTQTTRCELALAYPARLVAHFARAALSGDTTPLLGAYTSRLVS